MKSLVVEKNSLLRESERVEACFDSLTKLYVARVAHFVKGEQSASSNMNI